MKLDELAKWGRDTPTASPNEPDGNNSEGQCRSYKLDDDDNNLLFLSKLRSFSIPTNFVLPKISKYKGKGNPEMHTDVLKGSFFDFEMQCLSSDFERDSRGLVQPIATAKYQELALP